MERYDTPHTREIVESILDLHLYVHCRTKIEVIAVCTYLDGLGLRMTNGEMYSSSCNGTERYRHTAIWDSYRDTTCFDITGGTCEDVRHYEQATRNITRFNEFRFIVLNNFGVDLLKFITRNPTDKPKSKVCEEPSNEMYKIVSSSNQEVFLNMLNEFVESHPQYEPTDDIKNYQHHSWWSAFKLKPKNSEYCSIKK